jgi:hypothetical protein
MSTAWPIAALVGIAVLSAVALFCIFVNHLREYPQDVEKVRKHLASANLRVLFIRRERAVWRYHYSRATWRFSRQQLTNARSRPGTDWYARVQIIWLQI